MLSLWRKWFPKKAVSDLKKSREESEPRLFTQQEVNEIVKARLERHNKMVAKQIAQIEAQLNDELHQIRIKYILEIAELHGRYNKGADSK